MNREQRREMQRQMKRIAAGSGPRRIVGKDFIALRGGPMDGMVVKPDAPALREDWHSTWLDSIRERWAPGRYVMAGRTAKWVKL